MKLLDARVNGMPRQVTTKYGEKAVLDVATSEGNFTVWRPAGDMEVLGRRNGERVSIAIDSKGKASLVEHASNSPAVGLGTTTAEIDRPSQLESEPVERPSARSLEIADYIERLGKLYNHCCAT
jgi:hypothetical protein